MGTIFGLMVVLVMNHHSAFTLVNDERLYLLRFAKDVTFLQKIALKRALAQLPDNSEIVIDCGGAMFVDHDIIELIDDFKASSVDRHIKVDVTNFPITRFNLLSAFTQRGYNG